MTATGTFSDGSTENITNSVVWSTLNPTVAAVNAQGLVTSVAVGNTPVNATEFGIIGAAIVNVTPAVLVSIVVTPAMPSIPVGSTVQFTATGTFSDGSTQNITDTVQWSSSPPPIASIGNAPNNKGIATGSAVGNATITASSGPAPGPGSVSGSTTLVVTAATLTAISVAPANPSISMGTTQQFAATGTYSDSHTQNLTSTATWASNTPSTATVNAAGLANSVGSGTATISATLGTVAGSTVLTVTPSTLVSIAITPNPATIPLGTTQQFAATGTYSDGKQQNITQLGHWTSSNGGVATISNARNLHGLATSVAVGTTTIGITYEGVTGSASLTVSAAALVSIAITPQAPTIPLGNTQQFSATGTYTDGSTQVITSTVTWSSSSAAVAIISNAAGTNGLATSAGTGTTNISASSAGVSAQTTLTVGAAALVSIAITPLNSSIPVGTTQQFTATGVYTNGGLQNLTDSVVWSSSMTAVASISGSGLASAIATGATTIAAALGSINTSTTLTVTPPLPPTCSLQVSPTSGSAPLKVSVMASCVAHSGNQIATTMISFSDGFYQSGSTATHTFVTGGTFSVTVTATDTKGNTANATSTVTVSTVPSFFVGVNSGQIEQFGTAGNPLKQLNTNLGGSVTGMGFDPFGALYVTDFTADNVTKFDGSGNLVGNFGTGYNCKPESIVFDNAGNAYVGETGCSHALLKFDAYGNLIHGWTVTTEVEGSDWIDLAADQCTIFYTSQGTTIFRFNACTGAQSPVFAAGLHTGLGLRILPDQGVLVADTQDILRFDSAGRNISTYTASGENCLVSVTLDPDGTSFWAVDYCTSDILHFDLTSGNQLAKYNSGTPTQTVFGIAMRGAPRQTTAAGPLITSKQSVSVTSGQTASFNLSFAAGSGSLNQTFTFSCANLPIGASCSFSPQTLLATSTNPTVDVTVTTTGASASIKHSPFAQPQVFASFFVLPGIVLLSSVRRRRKLVLTLSIIAIGLGLLVACGGGSSSSTSTNPPTPTPPNPSSLATPAGTYPIIIKATSNSLVSSTSVSLTVQ